MGGAVAIVLAARHPRLVSRLVLVDANLDPAPPVPTAYSSKIASYTEEEFLAAWLGRGPRPGRRALVVDHAAGRPHRPAPHRGPPRRRHHAHHAGAAAGAEDPAHVPRAAWRTGRSPGPKSWRRPGVAVVSVPDCGHNIMLDNPEAFARAAAAALTPA